MTAGKIESSAIKDLVADIFTFTRSYQSCQFANERIQASVDIISLRLMFHFFRIDRRICL